MRVQAPQTVCLPEAQLAARPLPQTLDSAVERLPGELVRAEGWSHRPRHEHPRRPPRHRIGPLTVLPRTGVSELGTSRARLSTDASAWRPAVRRARRRHAGHSCRPSAGSARGEPQRLPTSSCRSSAGDASRRPLPRTGSRPVRRNRLQARAGTPCRCHGKSRRCLPGGRLRTMHRQFSFLSPHTAARPETPTARGNAVWLRRRSRLQYQPWIDRGLSGERRGRLYQETLMRGGAQPESSAMLGLGVISRERKTGEKEADGRGGAPDYSSSVQVVAKRTSSVLSRRWSLVLMWDR